MSLYEFAGTLITTATDGPALANSTVATSLLPSAALYTLPANYFDIRKKLIVVAHGRVSNIVTTPGTLTLDVRLGGVIAANSGAITINTTAKTNVSWVLWWKLTCRAIGSGTSANLMHQGEWVAESVVSSPAGTAGTFLLPASAPAVGTGFDSTSAQPVNLFATWSIANAGNSIQLHGYDLIALN